MNWLSRADFRAPRWQNASSRCWLLTCWKRPPASLPPAVGLLQPSRSIVVPESSSWRIWTRRSAVSLCATSAATPLAERSFAFDRGPGAGSRVERDPRGIRVCCSPHGGIAPSRARGIGVAVQAPVAIGRGEPVDARMMPGWDGFSIPGWFAAHTDVPVLVDSHVNVMALGEHWAHWRDVDHVLFVDVGTTIECGIVSGRAVHRGAHGAAGDIGHIRLAGHDDVLCPCGNTGCLEAVAGGDALAANLSAAGLPARSVRDVVALRARGRAGRAAGRARARGAPSARCWPSASTSSTPGAIVVGGDAGGGAAAAARGRARGGDRALAADGHARPAHGRGPARRPRGRDRRRRDGDRARARARRTWTARSSGTRAN